MASEYERIQRIRAGMDPAMASRLVSMLPRRIATASATEVQEIVIPEGIEAAAVQTAPGSLRVAEGMRAHSKGVAGPLVRADELNLNKAFFSVSDLEFGLPSLVGTPMVINHKGGAYGWVETADLMSQPDLGTFIDIVGRVWSERFDGMWSYIEQAIAEGTAALSMECVASAIGCMAPGCGVEASRQEQFCAHIRSRSAGRRQIDPTFFGASLVLPPERPGWADARLRHA
jgi:hypothetical protein